MSDQGEQGIQGKKGIRGVQGEQGDKGLKGLKGLRGRQGDKGNQGNQGFKGNVGNIGPQGKHGKGVSLSTVILIVVLPLFAYLYSNSLKNVDTQRAGCERTNITRAQFAGLLNDLVQVNIERTKAPGASPSEIRANQNAVDQYSARRDAVIESVDPGLEGHPVQVDCEVAYPKPWPLN
jgi:hypothetical protein